MPTPLYDTLKATATAHARAYESPNPWDSAAVQRYRTPECIHYLHPSESLPAAFTGPIPPPRFAQALALFAPVIAQLTFDILDTVVDIETRTVVVRLRATYDLKAVGPDEPAETGYTTEYMWLTEMEETGTKVVRVEEFMDVQRLMGHVEPKAERYQEMMAKGAGEG